MPTERADTLDLVVADVLASPRHAAVMQDLVRRLAAAELAKGRGHREAVKAVKGRLHQVAGAYVEGRLPFDAWLAGLRVGVAGPGGVRDACRAVMAAHASTRERLPILERFYAETLGSIGPVASVLDVACGLDPLAIPWMPLAPGASYAACDARRDVVEFLAGALPLLGVAGEAFAWDVAAAVPPRRADLALVLKAIPCLEQVDRDAGRRLLDGLDADRVLVSFPVRSLGGRRKGMGRTYEARMRDLVAGRPWAVSRFEFETELAFLVDKRVR